jgi:tRNA C32,U32 (ribose-2'-O)-methylase TrmJ
MAPMAPIADDVRFVLVRVRNPLNIGAAARAMANFGLSDLAAVEPFGPAWREARSAVGAEDLLRRARELSLPEALADRQLVLGATAAKRRGLQQPVVALPGLGGFLRERLPDRGRVAVLFGS